MTQHRLAILAALGSAALLAGCAAGPASSTGDRPSGGTVDPAGIGAPIPAPGEVIGQGTVIQVGDTAPQFCLGPVMESSPPQCSGPGIVGWDWEAVEGDETSGDVRWGAYAVTGTWDGEVLTTTSAIMLALYDPMPFVDPLLEPENAGDTSEGDLERIQSELIASAPFPVLTTWSENGYVFASVIYDDGRLQAWADETYLPDTVAIRPALRDVE